jgi:hypothetical protein
MSTETKEGAAQSQASLNTVIQQYVFDEDSVLYDVLDNMPGYRVECDPQSGWSIVSPSGRRGRLLLQWTVDQK